MKKIILLIALVGLFIQAVKAQPSYEEWVDTINVSSVTTYIDVRPSAADRINVVGGCSFSVTIEAVDLDADDGTIDIGGVAQYVSGGSVHYRFVPFSSVGVSILPYTLDTAVMADTTKWFGADPDTTYMVGFRDSFFGYDYPAYRFTKGSNTTGYLRVTWRFYLQR